MLGEVRGVCLAKDLGLRGFSMVGEAWWWWWWSSRCFECAYMFLCSMVQSFHDFFDAVLQFFFKNS